VQLFGPHLIIDGTRCDTQKLGDRILIEQILSEYPAAIGMTKIGGPYMFEYQAPDPAYSGVSGIVVIAESHIAIHTFPELDYFTMDIFSCKNFDHELAIRYIKDALDVKEMDRMLVQRGLSFRGPHHGANGATDELIAAAQARLEAGIISNETASPDDLPELRARLAAEHGAMGEHSAAGDTSAGRMIWPQYGVSPDVGTYGPTASDPLALARAVPLDGAEQAPASSLGKPLDATESLQVNPTASISGLLDKMGSLGSGGRALSRAAAEWERLARDPDCAIWLALSNPVIADGLRELLVYAVEHRFVDGIVLTGEDAFADVYEALGYHHYADETGVVQAEAGRDATTAFIARFANELAENAAREVSSGSEFLRALGEALSERAPRKGVLQAAVAAGVRVYAPGLLSSQVGAALRAARTDGACPTLDPLGDFGQLASDLRELPRFGVIAVGSGLCRSHLLLAREVGDLPAALAGTISLGDAVPGVVSVAADAGLVLPLLVTALAQRIPSTRGLRARARQDHAAVEEERLLA
jgi:S-adenosylmethionine decarboxylase